ncbi:thioredoxin-like domain-containing protein [Lipomyces kononenkoae]|uniref:Thioredoxin-like domain-containing protein n=1 Tax=Lipomyces kononenkoae TaxID=34357 RepID=A0ACC3TA33_LIPKO
MKISLISTFLAAASVAVASDVVSLTKTDFESFVSEHSLTLAEFFAPWCGHCKALAPEYEQAATTLKEKHQDIALAKIDCTTESELCNEQGIEGFPTLKVFRGGLDAVSPYSGQRKADAIVSYMVKQSLPAVSSIDKDTVENFKTADDVVIVGYFSDNDSNQTFTKVANTLRDNFLFGATSDEKLAAGEGVTVPAVVMYKNYDDNKLVFSGEFSVDELINFAKVESMPLLGEVGPSTYTSYIESGIPLAYLFIDKTEDKEKFTEVLLPLARKYRGEINIATIDANMYGQHAENINLKQEWPAFAIQEIATNYKYAYDQAKEITKDGLTEFLGLFHSGDLSPTIKSQPAPETQDGPVWVVTANTYDEIVLDEDKDVLIEFYATWCGHCKNLAPKYEELGRIFWDNEELKNKVVIAKVDTPNNDVPDDVRGFPTIKLYPAGDKANPIEYQGDRTVKSLADFVRDNGKYGIDGWAIAEKNAAEASVESEESAADHDEL